MVLWAHSFSNTATVKLSPSTRIAEKMENRVTSPSIFQLETMELKRMMKESGGGITEESPISNPKNSSVVVAMPPPKTVRKKNKAYLQRGQWLRAAVLGVNEGVVSIAWLVIGTGAGKSGAKSMLEAGLAAVAAEACSMAIGEFISVKIQHDVELANFQRENKSLKGFEHATFIISLPDAIEAACASALAFSVGALFPLISAVFTTHYITRVGLLAGVSSLVLILIGAIGAYFACSSIVKGSLRVLLGGWIACVISFGLRRLFNISEQQYEV
ncbi:vacuolar iron transporter homolog 2-like [Cryptomeria japonica]|uniref:vacuolar iron transporter homolog 2-like n=1 Tax=Cryptomeria japonica TaxID=3369 RepID=UPI0027D9CF37|nr:vacuolar iron transporter homolog 2-like [Cryptomeria japonica]